MKRRLLTATLLAGGIVCGCQQSVIQEPKSHAAADNYTTAVFFSRSEPYARHAVAKQVPNNDVALLIKVKSALTGEPSLKPFALEVGVLAGAVTLYGEVDTHEHRATAERVARNVHGVESVKSGIAVANRV